MNACSTEELFIVLYGPGKRDFIVLICYCTAETAQYIKATLYKKNILPSDTPTHAQIQYTSNMFTARSACSENAVTSAFIRAHKSTVLSALCNRNQLTKVQFCQRFATEISSQKYSSVSASQQKSAHKSTALSALCNRNQQTKLYPYVSIVIVLRQF